MNITELAQRMKAAAVRAKTATEEYASGHMSVSVCYAECEEFNRLTDGPDNIIALAEALEKTHTENGLARGQLFIAQRTLLNQQRKIAELESRTVTIEPFRSFVTDADLAALHRFAECCDDPESGGHDLRKEQVRRLEAIGALRRSGCVHWITGFGDVLISITAGIKAEADVSDRNKPGMVVAVHIDAGDFVKFRGLVYEVEETDFDDHDVTLWFVGGETLKCAAGCQIEVVSAPVEDE